jgi:hypothetical protein
MFRFTEPSSGQFLKQSTFSNCAHYGISYCFQVILTLKIMLHSVDQCVIWNVYKNSCQYIFIKIFKTMLAFIYIYIYIYIYMSNIKALVRGCLDMVEANIVSYWSCSKFWRTVNKHILVILCKAKFQVVYHMLILLLWRMFFKFFLLPSDGRLSFRLSITCLTAFIITVLVFWIQLYTEDMCIFVHLCVSFMSWGYLYVEGCLVLYSTSGTDLTRRMVGCVCFTPIHNRQYCSNGSLIFMFLDS